MRILTTVIAAVLLTQSAVRAEQPWRFLTLADWHLADIYVMPHKYPGAVERIDASFRMLKEQYGGELILLPGDSNIGHWDKPSFIREFNPKLTPAQSILQAGDLCYNGMVGSLKKAGYSRLLMAIGDHEVGDNPWAPGSAKSIHQPEFRNAFAKVFNIDPATGKFLYDKPIGQAPSRPLGTKYETTSYAYQFKNVLFVTVDAFHQEDPDKQIGRQGSVTGTVVGKHLVWLDHVLSEARKDASIKHVFVQSHLPVLQPVRRVNSSGMLMDDEMESDFWKTLRKHKVDLYFAGEVHSNTVTKDPKSDLVQIVTRAKYLNNLVTVDVTDDSIDIILYNQKGADPSDGKYEVYGRLQIHKSDGGRTFQDEGELAFLDRRARLLHFDFEENFALADRQVLGLNKRPGNPFVTETVIQGVRCNRSFPNRGVFGHNYDAQYADIASEKGPRGKAGVFNPNSQMAVYGAGPHGQGNIISYALWVKTASKENMILINTGRLWNRGLRGVLNLNLRNGAPELLTASNQRLIAQGQKLNDGKWHHVAASMPRKDCKLSEVQLYVDGRPVESRLDGQNRAINVSLASKVTVGGLGHGPRFKNMQGFKPFEGSLDEVSVWARALTAEEVAELAK